MHTSSIIASHQEIAVTTESKEVTVDSSMEVQRGTIWHIRYDAYNTYCAASFYRIAIATKANMHAELALLPFNSYKETNLWGEHVQCT